MRILFDDRHLHIGVVCFDSQGASDLRVRDCGATSTTPPTTFGVAIDGVGDGRSAVVFRVNPRGALRDQQTIDGGMADVDFDAVWFARTAAPNAAGRPRSPSPGTPCGIAPAATGGTSTSSASVAARTKTRAGTDAVHAALTRRDSEGIVTDILTNQNLNLAHHLLSLTRHNLLMPLVLGLTLAAGLTGTAVAQGTSAVTGIVLDDQGAAIPGALVALRQPSSGLERLTTTDGLGRFFLPNLPLGSHDVTAELSGFRPRSQRVELTTAVPVELSLTLALAPVTDIVTVRPVSAAIDTSSAGTRHAVSITRIERMPVAVSSRGLEAVLVAFPGFAQNANGAIHPRGAHNQMTFVVDGLPISDQLTGAFANSLDVAVVQTAELHHRQHPGGVRQQGVGRRRGEQPQRPGHRPRRRRRVTGSRRRFRHAAGRSAARRRAGRARLLRLGHRRCAPTASSIRSRSTTFITPGASPAASAAPTVG